MRRLVGHCGRLAALFLIAFSPGPALAGTENISVFAVRCEAEEASELAEAMHALNLFPYAPGQSRGKDQENILVSRSFSEMGPAKTAKERLADQGFTCSVEKLSATAITAQSSESLNEMGAGPDMYALRLSAHESLAQARAAKREWKGREELRIVRRKDASDKVWYTLELGPYPDFDTADGVLHDLKIKPKPQLIQVDRAYLELNTVED